MMSHDLIHLFSSNRKRLPCWTHELFPPSWRRMTFPRRSWKSSTRSPHPSWLHTSTSVSPPLECSLEWRSDFEWLTSIMAKWILISLIQTFLKWGKKSLVLSTFLVTWGRTILHNLITLSFLCKLTSAWFVLKQNSGAKDDRGLGSLILWVASSEVIFLCLVLFPRSLMPLSWTCVVPTSMSQSCTPPVRWPSVWTLTLGLAFCCGYSLGEEGSCDHMQESHDHHVTVIW